MNAFARALTGATTGPAIPVYPHPKTAVLAIDLQRDFLQEDGRKPIVRDQIAQVLRASNAVVDAAQAGGVPVVYVGNEFAPSDVFANLFRNYAAVKGTPGAAIDPRVHRVSDVYFSKDRRDGFSNPALDAFLRREQVDHAIVFGIAAEACVRATALGARNRGLRVTAVRDAMGSFSAHGPDAALASLAAAGVAVLDADEVAQSLRR